MKNLHLGEVNVFWQKSPKQPSKPWHLLEFFVSTTR